MPLDTRFAGVLLCFFLSGLAALLYETAWIREFSFVFGTSSIAVAAVLAAYMGGLATGAAAGGRLLPRVQRPILAYGLLEAGIAGSALAVPFAIEAATALCRQLLGGHAQLPAEGGAGVLVFFFVTSFVILMVPTAFMGATLPLLMRSAIDRDELVGPRAGLLYGTNTFGAVVGTLLAAFVLLPTLGLRATVWVGVGVNVAVFALAAGLARGEGVVARAPLVAHFRPAPAARWLLACILLSGVTSFTYEVLWIRLLSHILGGSIESSATMLGSFLAGIALGSAIAGRLARSGAAAARYFAFAQLGIALCSVLAYAMLDLLPGWSAWLSGSNGGQHLANAAIAASILLPGALFVGATFPFVVRCVAPTGELAGAASARVYTWNTIGAIVGALAATFVLIPYLAYRGTLLTAVAINVALALGVGFGLAKLGRRDAAPVLALAGVVLLAALLLPQPWKLVTSSPISVGSATDLDRIRFYGVGRAASVLAIEEPGFIRLYANGLPEAAIAPPGVPRPPGGGWLATLPSMLREGVQEMLVIGLGTGDAIEYVPSTVKRIEVVELEAQVVAANRAIAAIRARDPLADPRVELRLNDARGALLLTDARYDAIVSQPSHPWTAGASHLYTRDFFEQVHEHLGERGIFLQWIGLEYVDAESFRSLLATLVAVFPEVQVYVPHPATDAYFVAAKTPIDWRRGAGQLLARAPADARMLGIAGPEDLLAELRFDEVAVRALAEGAPLNTDDHNRLQSRSLELLRARQGTAWIQPLLREYDSRARKLEGLDSAYLTRKLLDRNERAGARKLARAERDPAQRALSQAWIEAGGRRSATPESRAAILDTLRRHPASEAAQVAWIESRIGALAAAEKLPTFVDGFTPRARALLAAWLASARSGVGDAVRQRDAGLAAFAPRDPGYEYAVRLRARWRLGGGERARCDEAFSLLDALTEPQLDDLVMRAEALRCAGAPDLALNAVGPILRYIDRGARGAPLAPYGRRLVRRLGALVASVPQTPENATRHRIARATLERLGGDGGAAR